MADFESLVLALLSSIAAGALSAGGIVWIAKSWISERLQTSIKHEYDLKLAAANHELQISAQQRAVELSASIEREAEKLRIATDAVGEGQKLVIAKKVEAIDTLWSAVISVRKNVPTVMEFIDILTVDEYMKMGDHPHFKAMVGEISLEKIAGMFEDNVGSLERIRPYVGEFLWAHLSTYQAFVLRVALLVQMGEKDPKKLEWHTDEGVRRLLRSAFSENEIAQFDAERIGKVRWLQVRFESRLLSGIQNVLEGREFGEQALQRASEMEAAVRELHASRESA